MYVCGCIALVIAVTQHLSAQGSVGIKLYHPHKPLQSSCTDRPHVVYKYGKGLLSTLELYIKLVILLSSVTGGELFEDIVAREYYSEADAR